MRILINALSIDNQSGTGRYTWGLIHGLIQILPKNIELNVFLPAHYSLPHAWKSVSKKTRFFSINVKSSFQRIRWEQFSMSAFIRKLNVDVMHSPAFIAPVWRKCPVRHVITLHDMAFHLHYRTLPVSRQLYFGFTIPASIYHASAIITDSLTVANEFNASMYRKDCIYPIPLGVNVYQFNPRKTPQDEEIISHYGIQNPYLLTVAALEPRKNLETVVKAFLQACERGYQGQLVLAGRMGWKINPQKWDHPRIMRIGYVPDEHLPALYRNAHAFLAPSWYEGFDLPCVESLACGTHVVASDIPVHREVLENSAFYLPADDVYAWSEALLDLPDQPKKNYQDRIRTWKQVARDTLRVYQDVAEE